MAASAITGAFAIIWASRASASVASAEVVKVRAGFAPLVNLFPSPSVIIVCRRSRSLASSITISKRPAPPVSTLFAAFNCCTVMESPEFTSTFSTPDQSLDPVPSATVLKLLTSSVPSSTTSVPSGPKLMTLPALSTRMSLSSTGRSKVRVPPPVITTFTKAVEPVALLPLRALTLVVESEPAITVTLPDAPVIEAVLLIAST